MEPQNFWRLLLLASALVTSSWLITEGTAGAQTEDSFVGRVSGTAYRLVEQTVVDGLVVDEELEPISNGRIAIPELDIDTPLETDAEVRLRNLPASADRENPTKITVVFSAPGLGDFTFRNVPIGPWVDPILTPVLIDQPRVDDLAVRPDPPGPPAFAAGSQAGFGTAAGCSAWFDTNKYPPQSIRVWENNHSDQVVPGQDDLVHIVDFNFYAKHVLPREWIPSWEDEALRAGAVAVKSFGWWHTKTFEGGTVGSTCYDVDATRNDQVFDPFYSTIETDLAVDATWDYYMIQGSDVVHALYKSGSAADACGERFGGPAPGNDMSAYGSQACALNQQMPWWQILTVYYFPPVVSWQLHVAAAAPAATLGPHTDTKVRLLWSAEPGLAYFVCDNPEFMSSFSLSTCSYLGLGESTTTPTIPAGNDVKRYYKILICGEFCSAPRGGGVVTRQASAAGMGFYGTAYYSWPYAKVAARNVASGTRGLILSDGAKGFGHVPKWWCPTAEVSSNCGVGTWVSANRWVTISQYLSPTKLWNGYLRLIRNPIGD